MTTATLYNHTCTFCAAIRDSLARFGTSVHYAFQMAGYARAAAELHRMGYHEAARGVIQSKLELQKTIDNTK